MAETRLKAILALLMLTALAIPGAADRVDDTIWDLLYGGTPDVRASAAVTLGRVNDSRAVEPLIEALKDEDEDVRCAAVDALGEIGDPRAVGPLFDIILSPYVYIREGLTVRLENREVRPRAVLALVEIGEPAVDPLIDALGNEDNRVRENAAEALGKIGNPRTVAPLIEALNDEDSGVRLKAVWALGEIGDPRAVAPLMKVKNDNSGISPPAGNSSGLTAADVAYFESRLIRDEAVEALEKIQAV